MGDRAVITANAPQPTPKAAPDRADLQLVGAHRRSTRPGQVVFGAVLIIMFTALLASAVFHSVLVAGQQRLDHVDQRLAQSQQELSRSRLRVAELSSPARVVAAAQQAGMIVPGHTIWLSSNGPSNPTTPGPPVTPPPATAPPSTAPATAPSAPHGSELAGGATHPADGQASGSPGGR